MADVYRGVVFSGGGSKGAYALGVMLALKKYQQERGGQEINFYCGTSVGALNATLAAQGGLEALSKLYGEIRTIDILGKSKADIGLPGLISSYFRSPYHYFNNDGLKKTIRSHVSFEKIKNSHLMICATNYLTGELETFYISSLIDGFIEIDKRQPIERRRLRNYHRIVDDDGLVDALLASAAIPFFFPPVSIGGALYVDGGIGNNTPLRQAAYFCRFLCHEKVGGVAPIICVLNDPQRFTIEKSRGATDIFGVIRRTIDIFQEELVQDSVMAWERISREVNMNDGKVAALEAYVDGLVDVPAAIREQIKGKISESLSFSTAATSRLNIDAIFIRPSSPLVDNILEFNPALSLKIRHRGAADCLNVFQHKNLISTDEMRQWTEEIN